MKEDLPIISANPRTIHSVLEKIINSSRKDIVCLGKKSRLYVEKWHNPEFIVKRIKKDIYNAISNLRTKK